jgi:hypothetical protein
MDARSHCHRQARGDRVSDESEALLHEATGALVQGRAGDAIASFEALADRGVTDANISYDRGLAYATRVRIGAELPGDLGRAAQGFEEARSLTSDPKTTEDASHALAIVRAEVARRRGRNGDPVELDQGLSLGRTVTHLVSEPAWSALALAASVVLGLGLAVRRLTSARRVHVAASIAASIAAALLVICTVLYVAMRDERLHRREGVIVATSALPADERGMSRPGASSLPEAALVEIVDMKPGWTHVRWGKVDGWVPAGAVRGIEKP